MKILKPAGGVFLVLVPAFAAWVFAGDLEPPAGPDDPGSAMYTLEDAYNRLDSGAAGEKRTNGFTSPSSVPGSTGRTIDQVMAKMPVADNANGAAPKEVAAGKTYWSLRTDGTWGQQTGTSTACATCTGTLSAGGRWCDPGDGTVKDMTTGLVWLKDASWGCSFPLWVDSDGGTNAYDRAVQVKDGTPDSLEDGSVEGDWRLPTKEELYGLANGTEAVRSDTDSMGPFLEVQSLGYWSSTTNARDPSNGWCMSMEHGMAYDFCAKTANLCVWPVRHSN